MIFKALTRKNLKKPKPVRVNPIFGFKLQTLLPADKTACAKAGTGFCVNYSLTNRIIFSPLIYLDIKAYTPLDS